MQQNISTRTKSIILVITCTLFTSIGQLLLKIGAGNIEPTLAGTLHNTPLIIGAILYIAGAVLLIYSLKNADLSLVYPFISLSFIWVSLLSFLFLNEYISSVSMMGIVIVIIGVCLVGMDPNQKNKAAAAKVSRNG